MRVLCDVCEGAAAVIFCAADEAALCGPCDEKVHTCNKLASRHIRVQLAEPSAVGRCDICENSPAFFFCMIDGSSLCLECDVLVHVGGKRSHERYLPVRQKIEFLGEKPGHFEDLTLQRKDNKDDKLERDSLLCKNKLLEHITEKMDRCRVPPISISRLDLNHDRLDPTMIDLNARPNRIQDQISDSS